MSVLDTIYICDSHGVSIGKTCCVNAEDTGWCESTEDSKESK